MIIIWMFPLTAKTKFTDEIIPIINDLITLLDQKLDQYFSSLDLKLFDWVRNPFNPSLETTHLSSKEEEESAKLKSIALYQMKFNEFELGEFWIYTKKYQSLTNLTLSVLLPFSTPSTSKVAIFALNEIKNKKRKRLIIVEEELRVTLSKISPRIDVKNYIMKPLSRALDILQGDKNVSLGYLLPTINALQRGLNKRFMIYMQSKMCQIAACLVPKFKLNWVTQEERNGIKNTFIEAVVDYSTGKIVLIQMLISNFWSIIICLMEI
ncbi:Hypothetical protein CINCED_3A005508 [Cinara cedri]|uniref:Uncharacterized protein n=1 Tax=Cinara cedri TaxID=506608 RepID=A0A5E4N2I0_9HEMI|nr:Hypothetical protein CINCED_3A005508 [Cinara cedri]